MILTTEQLNKIDKKCGLKGYPKSNYFVAGFDHYSTKSATNTNTFNLAVDAFKHGAQNDGCVACMFFYVDLQCNSKKKQRNAITNNHNNVLVACWALEGAIRGHKQSIDRLINKCFIYTIALSNFWKEIIDEFTIDDESEREYATFVWNDQPYNLFCDNNCDRITIVKPKKEPQKKKKASRENYRAEKDKQESLKKGTGKRCVVCGEPESKESMKLEKVGKCKMYSYCGKECLMYHWQEVNHVGEGRQLNILRKYYKPYAKEIRMALIRGDDPKEIVPLQMVRTKLGLNRPTEEYAELLVLPFVGDNDQQNKMDDKQNHSIHRDEYLTARKDGTVHIGSTPNVI